MSDIERLLNPVVPFAVAGASGYCFLRGIIRLLGTNPELAWREEPGRIISSTVDDSGKAQSADIRYTYQVDGDLYEGKRIAPIEIWASFSTAAADFVRKYPQGSGYCKTRIARSSPASVSGNIRSSKSSRVIRTDGV